MQFLKSMLSACCFCMIITCTNGQNKKVTNKIKIGNFKLTETFEVLKSDSKVRNGLYEGQFETYSEKGQYDHGKKTGIWESYSQGKLFQKYDYDSGIFLTGEPPKAIIKITQLDEAGNPIKELTPRNVYVGGDEKMLTIIQRAIRYPIKAMEWNAQGKVIISAFLSKEGKLSNEKPETSFGHGLEEEALRVFRLLPNDWVPTTEEGIPVSVKIEFSVTFTLSSS